MFHRPKIKKNLVKMRQEKYTFYPENLFSHPRLGWKIIPSDIVVVESKGQV